jgi:hypothetical protein
MVRRMVALLGGRVQHDPLPPDPAAARPAPERDPGDFRHSPLFAKFARPGFTVG